MIKREMLRMASEGFQSYCVALKEDKRRKQELLGQHAKVASMCSDFKEQVNEMQPVGKDETSPQAEELLCSPVALDLVQTLVQRRLKAHVLLLRFKAVGMPSACFVSCLPPAPVDLAMDYARALQCTVARGYRH